MIAAEALAPTLDRKSWATLVARACLRGWQLWRSDAADGETRYLLARWDRVKVMRDADEVSRFLDRVAA